MQGLEQDTALLCKENTPNKEMVMAIIVEVGTGEHGVKLDIAFVQEVFRIAFICTVSFILGQQ